MNLIINEAKVMLAPIEFFYKKAEEDAMINASHISLYFALYYWWKQGNHISPFEISRDKIMNLAKISSRKTFNKGMHVLHEGGYIKYIPSYNPEISSIVCLTEIN